MWKTKDVDAGSTYGVVCKTTGPPNPVTSLFHSLAGSSSSTKQPFTTTELQQACKLGVKFTTWAAQEKLSYHFLPGD